MNGTFKWIMSIISGVAIIVLAGWLITTSAEVKATSTSVAVLQAQYSQIKCDLTEVKDLVKEIRSDQVRMDLREKNK